MSELLGWRACCPSITNFLQSQLIQWNWWNWIAQSTSPTHSISLSFFLLLLYFLSLHSFQWRRQPMKRNEWRKWRKVNELLWVMGAGAPLPRTHSIPFLFKNSIAASLPFYCCWRKERQLKSIKLNSSSLINWLLVD